jgi:hypothetical protein
MSNDRIASLGSPKRNSQSLLVASRIQMQLTAQEFPVPQGEVSDGKNGGERNDVPCVRLELGSEKS